MSETTQEESKIPTKEEIISFLKEQIEVKELQFKLQELNANLASARAEELKALSFISQMTTQQPNGKEYEGGQPHTITEEDLVNNPELVEQGLKVGDDVIIPAAEQPQPKRSLKKGK
jgi:hypothetical protein